MMLILLHWSSYVQSCLRIAYDLFLYACIGDYASFLF